MTSKGKGKRKRESRRKEALQFELEIYFPFDLASIVFSYWKIPYFDGSISKPIALLPQIKISSGFPFRSGFFVIDREMRQIHSFLEKNSDCHWGILGPEAGNFDGPTGIVIENEQVFITDTWNCRIQCFSLSGTFLRSWKTSKNIYGNHPAPLAVTTYDQLLYVTTHSTPCLQVYSMNGDLISQWGTFRIGKDQCASPSSLVADELELLA